MTDDLRAALQREFPWWGMVAPKLAPHTVPVYDRETRKLVLLCSTPAHLTMVKLVGRSLLTKLNRLDGAPEVAGFHAKVVSARVVVTGPPTWSDPQLVEDVLLETWHDIVQDRGPLHLLAVRHVEAAGEIGDLARRWAEANGQPTEPVYREGLCDCPVPDHHHPPLTDEELIARLITDADLVLAFIDNRALDEQIADAAEHARIPVRRFTA
ncbi:NAD(P)-dependent oxidoreductase [Kitasatospora sp. NPDC087861]|uniref:NAD(P)-dependent oxidoreductase n=1 Tax=Kitasatospora sp. NPDC087861 TaxID=3364070 RepID=UPI00382117D5